MRILLVEDDAVLRDVVHRSLQDAGHRVDTAVNVEDAEYLWRIQPFDVVLLDLNLPHATAGHLNGTGLSVLLGARARGDCTPVLILTARDRTQDRIDGLNAGADDYLGKPFDLAEVEARLRALVRRRAGLAGREQVGSLLLLRAERRFKIRGAEMHLAPREFELLCELMTPAGRVVSKDELSAKLSGLDDLLTSNALDVFISRLRKKLESSGAHIRTIRGLGYVLEPDV